MKTKHHGTSASGKPPRATRKSREMDIDLVCGTLTHSVVARILTLEAEGAIVDDGFMLLLEQSAAIINAAPGLGAHRARVGMRVTTAAGSYLARYRPGPDVAFVGTEVPVKGGRIDIAWRHPHLGTFFDEIKTSRHPQAVLAGDDLEQVSRYVRSGVVLHGSRFAGVRYIPLLNPSGAQFVHLTSGQIEVGPLADSVLDISALKGLAS